MYRFLQVLIQLRISTSLLILGPIRRATAILTRSGMMNGIVDQFGTKVKTEEVDDNHFRAVVTVCPSPTFYRWIFGWNGSMKIVGPDAVKKEYRAMLLKALNE